MVWMGAALAFETPTLCEGQMRFYDDDGSFQTYDLRFEFDGPSYRIRVGSGEDGEDSDDSGSCPTYLTKGCRIEVPGFEGAPDEHYVFTLTDRGQGRYLYKETWSDGAAGQSLVTCRNR